MEDFNAFKKQIKKLISEYKLNQVFLILNETIKDEDFINKIILLQSRYNRLILTEINNIFSYEDLDRGINKISVDLLKIIDSITKDVYNNEIRIDERRMLLKRIKLLEDRIETLESQLKNSVGFIDGKRLFQYKGLYPIDIEEETNFPNLNHKLYIKAILYFLEDKVFDRLAASDIVYLRKDNLDKEFDILQDDDGNINLYNKLVDKYDLYEFIRNFEKENKIVLGNYIRIVNEIGETMKDTCFEILLHNVRNPLRSVIAAKNTEGISERKLYDPSTRFVVEYVKYQGKHLIKAFEGKGKIGYLKEFQNGKKVKATTIPIFHFRYGLIAIICINIG